MTTTNDIWNKTYFMNIQNIEDIYNFLDAFHEYCIDTEDILTTGNWGCPTEGREEEIEILDSISTLGFEMLENIQNLIKLRKRNSDVL